MLLTNHVVSPLLDHTTPQGHHHLWHTLLGLRDSKYRVLRQPLVSRKTFFDDVRALTRYLCFESWGQLLDFMLHGLEVAFPPDSS